MLRSALIGMPSSGKTTLFQLMTSAREAGRTKGDVAIGISKVPDERLDRLTAMYNPRKRVPATVEFTDMAAAGPKSTQALVDVAHWAAEWTWLPHVEARLVAALDGLDTVETRVSTLCTDAWTFRA